MTSTAFWSNLIAGQCGIDRITALRPVRASTPRSPPRSRTSIPAPAFPSPKEVRRTDRYSQFGVYAGLAGAAGFRPGPGQGQPRRDRRLHRLGHRRAANGHRAAQDSARARAGPALAVHDPDAHPNMASGLFSMYHNLRGPNFATCSACATANHASARPGAPSRWAMPRSCSPAAPRPPSCPSASAASAP